MSVLSGWIETLSIARLAEMIDGTAYVGFVQDRRLAFKTASVLAEAQVLGGQRALLARRFERLERSMGRVLVQNRPLSNSDLMGFIALSPTPATTRLLTAWRRGDVRVQILPGSRLKKCTDRMRMQLELPFGLYFRRGRRKPVLLIRALDDGDLASRSVVTRVQTLVHEWEHHEQSTQSWVPRSPMTALVDLGNPSRHEVLISEALAFLEEARWSLVNGLPDIWRLHDAEFLIPAVIASIEDAYLTV